MNRLINSSYLQSLFWAAAFVAVLTTVTMIVSLLFVDFIHGNPNRTQENAISMMKFQSPLIGFITFLQTCVVLAVPQFIQAQIAVAAEQLFGDRARFAVHLAIPLTALVTWHCNDLLTLRNLCFAGNCMEPYEEGLTLARYVGILLIQTPLTLFSFLYFEAGWSGRSRKPLLLVALAIAIAGGAISGYQDARGQYQFIDQAKRTM